MAVIAPAQAQEPARPHRPATGEGDQERTTLGVALVADVAGFTALTEREAARGRAGIERLGRTLDALFTRSLALVTARGGVVVSLAGDAIISCWRAEDVHDLGMAAARAHGCARDLLQLTREVAAGDADQVALHVGVGAGDLWAGRLPAPFGGTEWLWAGDALLDAHRACRAAGAGAMVASPTFARLLADAADPDGPDLAAPATAAAPLAGGAAALAAELRVIGAVFLRLRGFTEDGVGSWPRYRHAISLFHEMLGASSAAGRIVADQGGLSLVCVFGEPGGAPAQARGRTIFVAAGLVRRFEEIGVEVSAGLAFGRAFCGRVGPPGGRFDVVVGTPMNLAARLADRAARGLAICGSIDAGASDGPAMGPRELVTLKGFDTPVEIRTVVSPAGLRESPGRLFGRDHERQRLDALLDAASGGDGGALLLRGDPGLGKSALITGALGRARDRGIVVAAGAARPTERTTPYFPWRSVLRGLFVPSAAHEDEEIRSALRLELGKAGIDQERAPLLNVVMRAAFPETAVTERLTGRNRAEATVEVVCAMLQMRAAAPVLVVVEDVHLMDSASVELIDRLLERVPALAFLLSARPSAETSTLIYRLSGTRFDHIDLAAIDDDAVAALIADRLGGAVSEEVVRAIQEAADGNPLFAQEYLVLLRESGRLRMSGGAWHFAGGSAMPAPPPDTVLSAVADRIHALADEDRALIKEASVVGESFTVDDLTTVERDPARRQPLAVSLARLERSGLIVRISTHRPEFRFSHGLVRDAAYDLMLSHDRRRMHARLARVFEERYDRDLQGVVPQLVHHFAAAGDHPRTMRFADLAAAEALRQGAYREAAAFLRLCLDAADAAPATDEARDARIRWHRQLSDANAAMGELALGRASAKAALRAAGVPIPRSRVAAAVRVAARLIVRALRRPRVAAGERRGLHDAPVFRELAQAAQNLATSYYFANERMWFGYFATEAVRYAERGGRSAALARALAAVGGCLGRAGFHGAARAHLTASTEVATAVGDQQALAWVDMVGGLYHVGRGDWSSAAVHVARCEETCAAIGDTLSFGNVQAVRFWMHFYVGDTGVACATAERLLAHAQRTGHRQHARWGHRYRALCRLRFDDVAGALADLEKARTLLAASDGKNEVAVVLAGTAEAFCRAGRLDEGCTLADEALTLFEAGGRPTNHAYLESCSSLLEVAVRALERRNGANEALRVRRALRVFGGYCRVFPIGIPRLTFWRGCHGQIEGRLPQARRLWRLARRRAAELGMHPDVTLADHPPP